MVFADVPPEVVTCTSTVPGVSVAGEVAEIDVAELTSTPVAATPPKSTVAPLMKLVPVIVTDVPPPVGPLFGLSDVTAGCTALYVNSSASDVDDVPAEFVTVTSTMPGVSVAGDGTVIWVVEFTVTPAAAMAPKLTVEPATKPVPVIADVPPEVTTCTSTVPGVNVAGEVAVIDVAELTSTPVAATPPKSTVAPVMKLVPVIVTTVPPPVGPELGDSDVMAGCTA